MKRRLAWLAIAALGLPSCRSTDAPDPSPTATQARPVVYGEDDRLDVYAHPDAALRTLAAESIVALIPTSEHDLSDPDQVTQLSPNLQDAYNLCDDQRFLEQPTAASCSGTLIDDDLVLTAGHCATNLSDCRGFRYVFDYAYLADGQLGPISAADVYSCQALVVQELNDNDDFAIIQLDRPVDGARLPATVQRTARALANGSALTVIGFGSGLPAKIDSGGQVLDGRPTQLDYFVNSLDTFGGNSGSGVFDANRTLVGVLVRGEQDYVDQGACSVVNVLPDPPAAGFGEQAVYVHRSVQALCDAGHPSARLCGGPTGEGWCDLCDTADDCPDTWSCQPLPDSTQTGCALPCGDDGDCRDDHHCGDSGFCEADRQLTCLGGDVWDVDACLRRIGVSDDCSATERCQDGACVALPAGDVCANPLVVPAASQTLTGDLSTDFAPDTEGSCAGAGVDRVIAFDLATPMVLEATATGFDTVLYVRQTCDDPASELACNDDADPPGGVGSRIAVPLDAGRAYLFLDSWGDQTGAYQLDLVFRARGTPPDGDTCATATAVAATSQVLSGNLGGSYLDDGQGSCGGAGPDRIYAFSVDEPTRLTARMSGFDTVLHLRSTCTDASSELACNDDVANPTNLGSAFEVDLEAGSYALFADAWSSTAAAYTLNLQFASLCSGACTRGARRCGGGGVQECQAGPDGCNAFAQVETCGAGQHCAAAACVDGCTDACAAVGVTACADDTHVETCGDANDDGCLDWSAPVACLGSGTCDAGACTCAPLCTPGASRCQGATVQTCVAGPGGCPQWESQRVCASPQVCQAGQCQDGCAPESCALGDQRCALDDPGVIEACIVDGQGCSAWSAAERCPAGAACAGGACSDVCIDACDDGARRCVAGGYQRCQRASSGCLDWGVAVSCQSLGGCQGGDCVLGCADECLDDGAAICLSDLLFGQCADADNDGCLEWSGAQDCPEGGRCLDCACLDCPPDDFEPNDFPGEALTVVAEVLPDLATCLADEDWFSVLLDGGEPLEVKATHDAALGPLSLTLFDASGTLELDSVVSGEGRAMVTYRPEVAEEVLIRVVATAGGALPYQLSVALDQPGCAPGERRCDPDVGATEACKDPDGDGLYEWMPDQACPDGCADDGARCAGSTFGTWPDVGAPDTGLSEADAGAHVAGADGGCGCHSDPSPDSGWLGALLLVSALAWPQRRRSVG